MAKRNPDPTTTSQLDMFGALSDAPTVAMPPASEPAMTPAANDQGVAKTVPAAATSDPENDAAGSEDEAPPPRQPRPATIHFTTGWVDDEWWTLAMVCAYLKLGRKAVWERKRDPKLGFPQPVTLGSSRPRWRGQDVRAWAGAQH
jgi:predicted DNA-binding transcriptional regulator AlpA